MLPTIEFPLFPTKFQKIINSNDKTMKSFNSLFCSIIELSKKSKENRSKLMSLLYYFLWHDINDYNFSEEPPSQSAASADINDEACIEENKVSNFVTALSNSQEDSSNIKYGYIYAKLKSNINWEEYYAILENGCLLLYKSHTDQSFKFMIILYKSITKKLRLDINNMKDRLSLAIYHKYSSDYLIISPMTEASTLESTAYNSDEIKFQKFISTIEQVKAIHYPHNMMPIGVHNANPLGVVSLQSILINSIASMQLQHQVKYCSGD
jgi:hypothetical protein